MEKFMKKIIVGVLIIMMTIINGCSKEDDNNNDNQYQNKINQILNIQQKTHGTYNHNPSNAHHIPPHY